MRKVSQEDLDALNALVQDGLIEVVSIDEHGEPSYRLASQFTVDHVARTRESPGAPGQRPGAQARCPFGPLPLAVPVSVGRPSSDAAGAVKGAEGERSDPLTVSAMLPPRPTEGAPFSQAWGEQPAEPSRIESHASDTSRFTPRIRLGYVSVHASGTSRFTPRIRLGSRLGCVLVHVLVRALVSSVIPSTVSSVLGHY